MVVTAVADALVGAVMDVAVRDAVADAIELHRRAVGLLDAGKVVNVAVLDVVPGRRQRGTVAARQADAGRRHLVDVAAPDPIARAALDIDGRASDVADRAPGDLVVAAACDHDGAGARALEDDAAHADVLRGIQHEHRLPQFGEEGVGGHRVPGRRPEVEHGSGAVQIPLARLIQLLQHVQGVEALARLVAIAVVGRFRPDLPLGQVQLLDAVVLVAPVVDPVAMHPDIAAVPPALGPVASVGETAIVDILLVFVSFLARLWDRSDLQPLAGIGVTGQGHVLAVADELRTGLAAAAGDTAEVRHAGGLKVCLEDLAARRGVEAFQQRRIADQHPVGEPLTAAETDLFLAAGPVGDRGGGGPGVGRRELQGLPHFVQAAAHADHHAARGQRPGSLALADLVARPQQRRERPVAGAGVRLGQHP